MIEIKITGEAPLEVLADLTAFGWRCSHNQDVAAAAAKVYEMEPLNEPSTDAGASAPAPTSASAPKQPPEDTTPPEPYTETTPHDDPPPQTKAETKTKTKAQPAEKAPTLETVRAAGIEAARKHGNAAVKEILTSLGVANMTALPETDRTAFLEALEGLGEANA